MANKITIADVATATGVTKPTVKKKAIDLGIYEQMSVIDARGRRAMTAEQASILTHAIMQTVPEQMDLLTEEKEIQENAQLALIEALREQIKMQKDMLDEQKITIQALQQTIDAMNNSLESRQAEIDRLHAELARAHSGFAELAAAHWWQKRAVVAQYALPAASSASEN